ncbi:hypothetical protein Y032_0136g1980 [Ancylostoma ceylanicum]|uniref:Uncharacterized protein n=1 Tax=Ancylostoma ceylanicum TaxID=53326 RepID=A0A016T5H7_9BILA|nr:hypothetical protein Y032_0136g1980 [Ancylostoma ceylanicum]
MYQCGPGCVIQITHGKCVARPCSRWLNLCGVNTFTLGNPKGACCFSSLKLSGVGYFQKPAQGSSVISRT